MMSRPLVVGIGPVLACAAVAALFETATAQTRPPRDRVLRTAPERVAVRGRVTAADTGAPLARARVRASPSPGSSGNSATTDADGRYQLLVPPGLYTLEASKPAYMTLSYGQRRAFERGTLVEVSAGDTLDDVSFVLPRGAVVTGTHVDSTHASTPRRSIPERPASRPHGSSTSTSVKKSPSTFP